MEFFKYQGTGNDFVIIDNRENILSAENNFLISSLCDRKFGVGADGLILLENEPGYDFRMRYFNADGNEASMCGNGGRCIVAFARHLKIINEHTRFIVVDGEHEANVKDIDGNLQVSLKMQDVHDVKVGESDFFLDTGSPHYVDFVESFDGFDVYEKGKVIRYGKRFAPQGTNVNFVKAENDYLVVKTYERGVENETLSCGTGVVASVLSSSIKNNEKFGSKAVKTKGGELRVSFEKENDAKFSNIWLEGAADLVFRGEIEM